MQNEIGQQSLDNKLRLCYPIENYVNNPKYISLLYEVIAVIIGGIVQYNIKSSTSDTGINGLCNKMTDETYGEPIDRLAAVINSPNCLNYDYNGMIASLRNTNVDDKICKYFILNNRDFFLGHFRIGLILILPFQIDNGSINHATNLVFSQLLLGILVLLETDFQ